MIDDNNVPATEDITTGSSQDNSGEQESVAQASKAEESAAISKNEANIRALRQQAERTAQERDELLQRVRNYEAQAAKVAEDDTDFTLAPDDLAEGKHLTKMQKKVQKLEREISAITTESKIRSNYPDFQKVVSHESIERLKAEYPEVARTFNASTDSYATAVAVYMFIKKSGLYTDDSFDADKSAAHKNSAKPKAMASLSPQQGESPLSHANAFANGLTPELKKQLIKEMDAAAKRY